jgi:tetratricopeptide (TPR) repeat protein
MIFKVRVFVFTGLALVLASTSVALADKRASDAALYEQNGKALFESERWEEAAGQFAAAYSNGNDPAMLFNMALCYRRAGNNQRALGLYQRFLLEAPPGPNRAVAQARIKDLQHELATGDASPVAPTSAGPAKDAATYEQDGKRLFEAGRWAEAAGEFEGAYRMGKDPTLLYNTALCHRKAGNAKRALEFYQQYLREVPGTPKRATIESRITELQQELASAGQGSSASSGGCSKDSECKGTRVCEQGRCVEQQSKPAASSVVDGCDPPCGPGRICSGAGACVAGQGPAVVEAGTSAALGPKSYAFGVGVGYAAGGTVTWAGSDYSPDGGFLLDLYFDKMLVPALSVGAYVTLSSMSIKGWSSADVSYQSFGGVLKARFELSHSVHLRPGLTLGYNRMSSSAFDDTSTGMNVGMHVDLAIATSQTFAIVPRLGFFTQPSGGYPDHTITFGPHFYLAVALELGR